MPAEPLARVGHRVLPLGDDDQTDTPRRPEFWMAQAEFGVVEEWACWTMLNDINPLSDLSLAGLRGLVKEFGEMEVVRPRDGSGDAGELHGRAWVAAEYRVAGSPHEWTDADSLAMARFILAGPPPAQAIEARSDETHSGSAEGESAVGHQADAPETNPSLSTEA